jgi:hypothetical protein
MRPDRIERAKGRARFGKLCGRVAVAAALALSVPAGAFIGNAAADFEREAAVAPLWFEITPFVVPSNLRMTIPRFLLLAAEAGDVPDLGELREAAGHGHLVGAKKEFALDAAIFTDLSPVTADETPVKLPLDQALE